MVIVAGFNGITSGWFECESTMKRNERPLIAPTVLGQGLGS